MNYKTIFRVPLAIVNKAHQANQLYPFAISLIESVRTYERTLEKVKYIITHSLLTPQSVTQHHCSGIRHLVRLNTIISLLPLQIV